jgi:hypothetical protein
MAWAFLVAGFVLYCVAIWRLIAGQLGVAVVCAIIGWLLRRQVRMVAPQFLERLGTDLLDEDARGGQA